MNFFRIYFFLLLILISCNSISLFGQSTKDTTALIIKTHGTSNSDVGYSVDCDISGNMYASSRFQGNIFFGSISLSASVQTAALVKYSTNGTVLWAKSIGSTVKSTITKVKVASDGTIWCGGSFVTNAIFGSGIELVSTGSNAQSFIAQFNANGTCLQAKKIENMNGTVEINSLAINASNSVIVGGKHEASSSLDTTEFGNGIKLQTRLNKTHGFVAQFSSTIICQWAKQLESDDFSEVKDLIFDISGDIVAVGEFYDTVYASPTILVGQPDSNGTDESSFIVKYSSTGVPAWIIKPQNTGNERLVSLTVDQSNNYYVIGTSTGSTVGVAPLTPINANHSVNEEILVFSLNSSGNGIWIKSYGSTGDEKAVAITFANDGNLLIAGKLENTATFGASHSVTSNGGSDGYIAKLVPSTGNALWVKGFGGAGGEFVTAIAKNSLLGFSAIGYSTASFSLQGVTYPHAGGQDIFTMVFGELQKPTITKPIGTISTITDTLKWTSVLGADSSQFLIRENDSTNGQIIFNTTVVKTDSLLLLPSLRYGRKYFIRSQSKIVSGLPSGFSSWSSFTVDSLPVIEPVSPLDQTFSVQLQTELRWKLPKTTVDSVFIQVKRDNVTSATWQTFAKTRIDTIATLPLLNQNRVYFWRGKSKASNGDTSSWSQWFTFSTENLLDPKIISPLDEAVNRPLDDTLKWNTPSSLIDTVFIQIREGSENGTVLVDQFLPANATLFRTNSIASKINTRYVWRLRFGSKQLGSGQWSSWNSYNTILPGGAYNTQCAIITGSINDDAGDPIQNGIVVAWRTDESLGDSTIFIFSDSITNGSYKIKVPEGNYLIFTSGEEFFTKWYPNSTTRTNAVVQAVLCQDSIVRNISVTQNPLASQDLTIRGTVRSKSTNLPIIATIQLLPVNNEFQLMGEPYTTTSDASGRYQFTVPALNKYLGTAIATDHSLRVFDTATAFIEGRFIRSGMTDPTNVNYLLDEIPVPLQNNGIQGRLTDSSNNGVQGNVIIYRFADLNGDTTVAARFFYSASSDSSGNFLIRGIEKGRYKLMNIPNNTFLVPGFYTFPSPYCIPDWNNSTTIQVDDEVVTLQKNVISRKVLGDKGAATWTISVLQKTIPLYHKGKLVEQPQSTITEPGVIITLFDKDGKVSDYAFTDVNGNASSSSLTVGTFEYEASKVGFIPKKGKIVVTATGIEGGSPIIELERIKKDPVSSVYLEDVDGVSVYPNPTKRSITIANMPNITSLKSIQIQDIRGKEYVVPFDVFYSEGRIVITVDVVPAGWYTVTLSTDKEVYTHQFIKE